jgi:hypothetical protein
MLCVPIAVFDLFSSIRHVKSTFLENEAAKTHILQPCDANACPSRAHEYINVLK